MRLGPVLQALTESLCVTFGKSLYFSGPALIRDVEAEPDLCDAFQFEKLLLCVRRTEIGAEQAGLCSRFLREP